MALADIRIYVKSPLGVYRNSLPRLLDCLTIKIGIDNAFLLIQLVKDFSVWVDDHAMAPSIVVGSHVSSGRTETDINLVVHSSCACLKLPMQFASGEVEGTGVDQQESTLSCGNHGQFGKANVVADGNSNLSVLGQIDQSDLVSRTQNLALLKPNLAGDIDVE